MDKAELEAAVAKLDDDKLVATAFKAFIALADPDGFEDTLVKKNRVDALLLDEGAAVMIGMFAIKEYAKRQVAKQKAA